MSGRLSRRKLAEYAAEKLLAGDDSVVAQLAAHIVTEKRQREVELLVRDIEAAMAARGTVVAMVTTAQKLTDDIKRAVTEMIGGDKVVLRERQDVSVIGGIVIDTPDRRFDGTVRRKLNELRAQKI